MLTNGPGQALLLTRTVPVMALRLVLAAIGRATVLSQLTVWPLSPQFQPVGAMALVMTSPAGSVSVTRTAFHKCGRCWRSLPEVSQDGDLCGRCETVVAEIDAGAAA